MISRIALVALGLYLGAAAAADVHGAFGFELSTNASNYEIVKACGTSDNSLEVMTPDEGERFRIFQSREPLRRYYCVKFPDLPSHYGLDHNGLISTYEGWIATIIAKSKAFKNWSDCRDQRDKLAEVLGERYGEPLDIEEPFYWATDKKTPTYKHHMLVAMPVIWESVNSAFLNQCNKRRDGDIRFTLVYESELWQKVVANWRSVMEEQRQLETERSRPRH